MSDISIIDVLPIILVIVAVLGIFAALIISFILSIIDKKRKEFVKGTSVKFRKLMECNNNQTFIDIPKSHTCFEKCKNKRKFDRFDYKKKLFSLFEQEDSKENYFLDSALHNQSIHKQYKELYQTIVSNETVFPEELYFKPEVYKKLEDKVLTENELNPVTVVKFKINWSYTSPQGRNHYENQKEVSFDELIALREEYQRQKKERESFEAQKRAERAKLGPLRTKILARDNYRCQMCGISLSDGPDVHLEVDHIVPVSQGGLSVENNLRTLCRECNQSKKAMLLNVSTDDGLEGL